MSTLGPFEVHPFADAFPLIEGEEFDEMVLDVKRNGLRDPILLNHERTVLVDGRNRYRACDAAGVEAEFDTLPAEYSEAEILDLIVSKNIARRQLTAGQRAFLALEYEKAFIPEAKEQQREAGRQTLQGLKQRQGDDTESPLVADPPQAEDPEDAKSRTKAARTVGASPRAVQRAKSVETYAPELVEKVRSGHMPLDQAEKHARQRRREMTEKAPSEKPTSVMLTLRTHDGREVEYAKPEGKATFNQTDGDGISWARWSWNPITGCLHGCDYCYAREITLRFKQVNPAGFTPLFHHERLGAPAHTRIPEQHADDPSWRRVFVCSMADLYGRWVPEEWLLEVHSAMLSNPMWEYLLLTKFPARYNKVDLPPSAWVGTSVDEQKRVRIAEDAFRQIEGVKVKWLSLEPLKEPLEFSDLSMFDWVVIGAQTETWQGEGTERKQVPAFAPPFDWVTRLVAQAREAGCRVHLKPNLVNGRPGMQLPDEYPV
jgi:protein gp37/ParB-like chromosome segregation protein Spo0J